MLLYKMVYYSSIIIENNQGGLLMKRNSNIALNWLIFKEKYVNKNMIVVSIYLLLSIFFMYKVNYYNDNVGKFPDEGAHISYIAYLEAEDKIIPDFREMELLKINNIDSEKTYGTFNDDTINYLGHPPLYYNILRFTGAITVNDGSVSINMGLLRTVTHIISYLALFLAFYIGYTRIKRVMTHILYGSIVVSIPMLAYSSAGISNDSLCFLGINIVVLGVIRVVEEKRNLGTYLLIASGVFISLLTKLTAGLIVLVGGFLFLIYIMIKEKSLRVLFCREFAITLPIYLIVLLYYLYNIKTYGGINPSLGLIAPEYYKTTNFYVPVESRRIFTFTEYVDYFFTRFIKSWTGIHSHISVEKDKYIFSKDTIAIALVLILPAILIFVPIKQKISKGLKCFYIGGIVALAYQFYNAYNGVKNVSGYLGGFQSRYYLCIVMIMALIISLWIDEIFNFIERNVSKVTVRNILNIVVILVCITFVVLLFYEDFIYFLNNYNIVS